MEFAGVENVAVIKEADVITVFCNWLNSQENAVGVPFDYPDIPRWINIDKPTKVTKYVLHTENCEDAPREKEEKYGEWRRYRTWLLAVMDSLAHGWEIRSCTKCGG